MLIFIALLMQEQGVRDELDAERRMFADVIDSSFALKASLDQFRQLSGSEASDTPVTH